MPKCLPYGFFPNDSTDQFVPYRREFIPSATTNTYVSFTADKTRALRLGWVVLSNLKIYLFFIILFGMGCSQRFSPDDNTFYATANENIKNLDPMVGSDIYSHNVSSQIFESLYHFHYLKRPIELEPQLAVGYPQVAGDGKTYTFKIRNDVFFHDNESFPNGKGRKLVAKDFIFSWKHLADPRVKSESFWVFQDKIVGLDEWRKQIPSGAVNYDTPIEGLQAPDDETLIVKLNKPFPQLLLVLAMPATSALPREAVEFYGNEFGNHPVGTGAFMFESWIRSSRVTMVKNPNYREVLYPSEGAPGDKDAGFLEDAGKRLPFVDKIVFYEISQEQPRWLLFLKGDLDLLLVSKDYTPQLVDNGKTSSAFVEKGIEALPTVNTDTTYVSFNTENPFLKNKKVRQALSLAYDHETTLQKFFNRLAVIAHGPIPPNLLGYRKNVKNPNVGYNIERAKRLLAEAGYPGGQGLPEFNYEMPSGQGTARQMAEYFKQQMAMIGVKVRVSPNTWPQFMEKVKIKKADIFEMAWNADYPDAENFLQLFYSKNAAPGPNYSNFKNAAYDALYEKAILMPLGPERYALYEKMEDILMEEAPWIPNMHRVRTWSRHTWLKNYKSEMMIQDTMKYYRIDAQKRAEQKRKL